ncbi:MAG: FtsQ-type POTRA domain-containing protein [gamma proteobacterium symbiont of Bathyaustriella thionipta]|nr:FtsQ-type POTRA domain-containing protein [gamma proteobacterium symbiont of Bathyaustriella thionipta]MCU7949309.1 FtsQ-type POTRA domain-containing protein [gamma proteobacterium symbiont of Bathyaustriella thionipta]MCU7953387.1 FtsQ-type POTRA domain-containing protein [gamma proteobacterium symbiont of Bathyaustriella thionipta]MCU7955906.1 FtsQ-type POTRA domain-containing protein [gamma proteobacterium symbiont of Bathyaustriella thionipta]MCU7968302.1 FtsQ-type POTRA domain-containin
MGNSGDEKSEVSTSKVLTRLLLLIILMGLLSSTWLFVSWLNKPGNFPFTKVELINQLGNQKSNELQNVTAKALNGGFFSLNVGELRAELLTKLPWVKSVSVRKVWPNKLLLKIIEHKPVARWLSVEANNNLNDTQLLSQYGIVFNPVLTDKQKQQFAKMTLLTGTHSHAEDILKNCVNMIKKLKQLGLGVKQCGMNKRRSWMLKLFLDNDLDLQLGKENIMQQLERFIDVFSGQLNQYLSSVESADLRYSNGFSVKWRAVDSLDTGLKQSLQKKALNNKSREQNRNK